MLDEKRRLAVGLDDLARQSLEDEMEEAVALQPAGGGGTFVKGPWELLAALVVAEAVVVLVVLAISCLRA